MTNRNEAHMLLRMVAILAGALRQSRENPLLADDIGAAIERVSDLMKQKGPNGADEADEILRECGRKLWGRAG